MLEKFLLLIAAAVGGQAAITGTFPAVMIALFGNPSVLAPVTPTNPYSSTWNQILHSLIAPGQL